MPKLRWAALCKNIVNDLRSDKAYVDKHANLLAIYMYSGQRCFIIPVWVPKLEKHVSQYACVCFINPSVISVDIPHEYVQYFQETIMIYPKDLNEIMVFSPNMEKGGYILEILVQRRNYNAFKEDKMKILVPQSYSEISNLLTILNPIFHKLGIYRYV